MFTRFKELSIGDVFDFIDDANPTHNSYFHRCEKVSRFHYRKLGDVEMMRVGTIMCKVFHVEHASIILK